MPDWAKLLTEQRNPASELIDEASTLAMLGIISDEDALVPQAVKDELPQIAIAVDLVTAAFRQNGRLFYLGAGTSGRLGILDASECPPTFRASPELVQGFIAGGDGAMFRAVEGAEDDPDGAISQLHEREIQEADIVMGIAASGVTPYVLGGLTYARSQGCKTIFFTCSPQAQRPDADVQITPRVGPEVLTGSTRMKAGTATKLVLNMITTGAMIKMGKTHGNLMVDLHPSNKKLVDRCQRIFSSITGLSSSDATDRLEGAKGDLKIALVMEMCSVDLAQASVLLQENDGIVKRAVRSGLSP
ncbi:MAG: N-acetylmuramic acid 6-phosphate etherase [Candidatus Latescibacterota bacterium]